MDKKIQYGLKRMIMVTVLEKIQKIYAIYGSSQSLYLLNTQEIKQKILNLSIKIHIIICPLMLKIDKNTNIRTTSFSRKIAWSQSV